MLFTSRLGPWHPWTRDTSLQETAKKPPRGSSLESSRLVDPYPSRQESARGSTRLVNPCSSHQELSAKRLEPTPVESRAGAELARAGGTPGLEGLESARLVHNTTTDMSSTLNRPKALTACAYTPHGHFRRRGRGGSQSTLRRDKNLLCWYCNKKEHKQANCYTKKKAQEAREQKLARRSRKGEGGNTETAGAAYALVQALAARIGRTAVSIDWIIASGASYHLCHNQELLVTFKRLLKRVIVHLGDNSTVPAIAAGLIHLTLPSRVISIESLFVPQLLASLLSVSQP